MDSIQSNVSPRSTNQWMLVSFALIGFVVGYGANEVIGSSSLNINGGTTPPAAAAGQKNPTPTAPTPIPVAQDVTADDDPFIGEDDAPLTLIAFTDYQCPYCGRHAQQTDPQIEKEYVDTGKLKYVIRDFPLSFHPFAQKAAEASECANDQGKFWEMYEKLFTNQTELDIPSLETYAADIGLDATEFKSCLDDDTFAAETAKDLADGQAGGITGTPGFILIGKDGKQQKISGALPFASFKQLIDAAL